MKFHLIPGLPTFILAAFFSPSAHAATRTWEGDSSNAWATATNWATNILPINGDSVQLPDYGQNRSMNNNLAANLDLRSLTFEASGYILNGNTIDLDDASTSFDHRPASIVSSFNVTGTTTINVNLRILQDNDNDQEGLTIFAREQDAIIDINGSISEVQPAIPGNVFIGREGTVRFDGNMTYTGFTRVGWTSESPTLLINGSVAGDVELINGTLGGSGTIGGDLELESVGVLSPGDPNGDTTSNLTVSGVLRPTDFVSHDPAIHFDLHGGLPGSSYDQIDANGVNCRAGAKVVLKPNRVFGIGATFILINNTSASPINGVLLDSTGASLIEGSRRDVGLNRFEFSYVGGDGNDFTATVVPAVSTGNLEWDAGGTTVAGGSTQLFSNTNNWNPNTTLSIGKTLVFGSLAPIFPVEARYPVNDMGGNFYSLVFTSSGYVISSAVAGDNDIILSSGISASHPNGNNEIENELVFANSSSISLTSGGNLELKELIANGGNTLTFNNTGVGQLRISGGVTGTGGLVKTGTGQLFLSGSGSSSYLGVTEIQQGRISCSRSSANGAIPGNVTIGGGAVAAELTTSVAEQIADTAVVTLSNNGTLAIGGTEIIGGLIGNGGGMNNGGFTLAVKGNITANQDLTIASTLQINTSETTSREFTVAEGKTLHITGLLAIPSVQAGTDLNHIKKGPGTFLLGGDCSNFVFRVDAGTLQVNTSHPSNRAKVSLNGGMLTGIGRTRQISSAAGGGTFSPGLGTSSHLWNNTGLSLNGATTLTLDLNGTAAGSGFDQLVVTESGTVSLGSAQLVLRDSQIFPTGTTFRIIDNDGTDAISGTFSGLPPGTVFLAERNFLQISYTGGTGNDVTLTVVTPPLPVATGTTRTWDGGAATNEWSLPANWVGDVAPQPGDSLVFPLNQHPETSTNDYVEGFWFDSISFTGSNSLVPSMVVQGSGINLLNGISANVSQAPGVTQDVRLELNSVAFDGAATITNSGARTFVMDCPLQATAGGLVFAGSNVAGTNRSRITFDGGYITGSGAVTVKQNAELDLSSTLHNYAGNTVVEFGRITGAAAEILTAPLVVGGLASVAVADLTGNASSAPGAVSIGSNGTLNVITGDLYCSSVTLNGGALETNDLTVNVSGTFTVNSGIARVGDFGAASLRVFGGSFTSKPPQFPLTYGAGTVTVPTIELTAGLLSCGIINGSDITMDGGELGVSGTMNADVFTMNGGLFRVPSTVNLDVMNLLAGSMSGSSSVALRNPTVYNIALGAVIGIPLNGISLTTPQLTVSSAVYCTNVTTQALILQNGTTVADGTLDILLPDDNSLIPLLVDGSDSITAGTMNCRGGLTVNGGTVSATTVNCPADTPDGPGGVILSSGSLAITTQLTAPIATFSGGTFTGPAAALSVLGLFDTDIPVSSASLSVGSLDTSVNRLNATGAIMVAGAANTSGVVNCASLAIGSITINNTVITVAGNASIGGDLTIDNTDSLTCGSLSAANISVPNNFSSVLSVAGDIVLSGNVSILKTLTFNGRLSFTTVGGSDRSITVGTSSLTLGGLGGVGAGSQVAITKLGSGTVHVRDSLTHISQIEIKAGRFQTDANDGAGVGHVLIDGGTLAGKGTLGPVSLGANGSSKIAPGNIGGAGILTMHDYSESSAVSPLEFEVSIFGTVAGESYDQVRANGSFVLNPSVQTQLNMTLSGIFFTKFIPLVGAEFVLVDKSSPGPVFGQFYDGTVPITEGFEKNFTGNPGQTVRFRYSYVGGDGNDFTATVISSPFGEERDWTGLGADSNWSTATNWEGDQIPSAGEYLRFPAGAARTTNVNNLQADLLLKRLDIQAPYTITGNAVVLKGDLNFSLTSSIATFGPPITFQNAGTGEQLITLIGNGSARVDAAISLSNGVNLVLNRVGVPTLPALEVKGVNTVSGASGAGIENRGGGRVRLLAASRSYDQPTKVLDGTMEILGQPLLPGNTPNPVLPPTAVIVGGGPTPAVLECISSSTQDCISNASTVRLLTNGTFTFGGTGSGDVISTLSFEGGTITNTGVINMIDEVRVLADTTVNTRLIFRSLFEPSTDEDQITISPGVTLTVNAQVEFSSGDTPRTIRVRGGGALNLGGIFKCPVARIDDATVRALTGGQIQVTNIHLGENAFLGAFDSGVIKGFNTTTTANIHPSQGSVIGGSGKIFGSITGPGAIVSPSSLSGGTSRLTFEGPFQPPAGTTFRYEIGGATSISGYDLLRTEFENGTVSSPVGIGGTRLDVSLINGFVPTPGQKFTLLLDQIAGTNNPGRFADGGGGSLDEGEQLVINGYVFTISYNGNNLSAEAVAGDDIELTAIGPVTEISVEQPLATEIPDGGSVDFGPVTIGSNADLEFTIRNSGVEALSLTADPDLVSITGDSAFRIEAQPSSSSVAGGGTTTFTVRFSPNSVGPSTAQLEIKSNDSDEGTYIIHLAGTGISPVGPAFASEPVILPATATEPAKFSAAVAGAPGAVIKLEASTDLGVTDEWEIIGQITLDGSGEGQFSEVEDPSSVGESANFFRLAID